jgi:PAS domain S-box-containing protein
VRLRKKLQRLDETFRAIFEQAPVASGLVERNGTIIAVNEAAARLLGYSRREFRGKRILDLNIVAPEERPKVRKALARLRAWLPTGPVQTTLVRKDGTRVFVEAWGFVVESPAEKMGLIIFVDISDRVRAQELTLQRQKELKHFFRRMLLTREESKRRFQEDVHREIGHVTGAVNVLADSAEENIRRGDVEAALESCRKFKSVFGDFISRLRNMALDLRPPELDLLGLRSALAGYLSGIEKETGLKIDLRASLDETRLGEVMPIALFRTVQEAVNNILRHSHAKRAGVDLRIRKGRITLAIRDDGQGFDVSQAGHNGNHSIGLRLIREMADSQDGTFEVRSQPGKGTELLVSLPALPPRPRRRPAAALAATPSASPPPPRPAQAASAGRPRR